MTKGEAIIKSNKKYSTVGTIFCEVHVGAVHNI